MAELSKYFPNVEEYETYVNGGNLPSNVLAVVLTEDGDDVAQISFATNDITGTFETFTCVGDQAYAELQEAYNEKVQELEAANATIATQTQTISTLEGQVTSLTNDLAAANETIGQLRLDLAAANETIASQTQTISSLEGQVTSLTADLAAANGTIADLQSQVASLTSQVNSLHGEITAADTALQAI